MQPSAASSARPSGRVAIVTGGAGGIGRAVAARLAAQGDLVAILDIDSEAAEQAVRDISAALPVGCDVRDRTSVRAAVAEVVAKLGPPRVLVNSAGVFPLAPFLELTDGLWSEAIATNLTGTFIASQEVAGQMPRGGGGSIVSLSSVAAVIANSGQAAYAVTKAGVLALTRAMAFELAPLGITVNAVAPGPIESATPHSPLTATARDERLGRIPVARFGSTDEVASAVVFLASSEARYITGSVLWVDGGLTTAGIRG
jgi:NAD(P)-dependent dehydrogenase (short-subunit alcohol dehydrogenase family)